jgi:pSer/pThr/pTyr-binding forkhead associated (FHA) protein
MARLVLKGAEFGNRVIELNLGLNRFGRSPDNDFPIEHPTVSASHCELFLADDGVVARDCASTNGTFLDDRPITEARLAAGQTLRLGDVELLVETTEVTIAIPSFTVPRPAPPVVLADGSLICPRHPKARATHQCTHCREVLCDECVHRLRRRGGKLMKFCPLCSHPCVALGGEKRKKKSLLGLWRKTVKLPFLHGSKSKPAE